MSRGPWRVTLAPAAERELGKLPPDIAARLSGPILALAADPFPAGTAKLTGTEFWRIRVGDVRVIHLVDEAAHAVIILRVARRAESTYRRLH